MIDYLLPDGVMRPGRSTEVTFNKNNGDMKVKYNPPQDDDKNNSYVIISKIDPGNVTVKPIPINPITIRDRFRKTVGKVDYLKF